MSDTKVITGEVRLSYANLFEPRKANDEDPKSEAKYGTSILIPKTDTETVDAIKAAIKAAVDQGKATKFGGKATGLKNPLRDGDTEREDDETYAGMYFINANSKRQPVLLDANNEVTTDEEVLYSGVYARVSLNFFPYAVNGNKGVAAGLNAVIKVRDGDALGNVVTAASAAKDFGVDLKKGPAAAAADEFKSGTPAADDSTSGESENPWED